ncbi:MAG: family 16 glycosylhydrolase [Reinekea sp.]|nr:family 16 glycosylhydrolase [Reinekea sp.]
MRTQNALILFSLISSIALAEDLNQDTLAATSQKNTASQPVYGAELYSLDKVLYGQFNFRLKMVSKPGVVSSFFTYDNESWQGEGRPWREIDFETIGRHPDLLQTNLITGTAASRVMSEQTTPVENITDFHTYSLIWTPERIVWKVDGQTIREDLASTSQQVRDMADTPQTYRSNVWVSEVVDWVGQFDETDLPQYQIIDWIEYYNLQDNGEFKLAWRDDFNHFDSKRWGKGNWTFDSNLVTFAPENIQVVDGQLIMGLTIGSKGIKR